MGWGVFHRHGGGQKPAADTSDIAAIHQKLILKKEEVAPAVDTSNGAGMPKPNRSLATLLRVRGYLTAN
jgi:hypothetical protein